MSGGARTALRIAIATIVAAASGFFGFVLLFADPSPGGASRQYAWALALHAAGGAVVGALLPRYWPAAGLAAWGALLLTSSAVARALRSAPSEGLLYSSAPLAVALAAGWTAARLRRARG